MYQPQISDGNIRKLYQLKTKLKKPMTHVLDEILQKYFASYQKEAERDEQKNLHKKRLK
jgi:hypothetical protein